jgi:signal transduction histidine kinase/CheY-like chemotaxis protein
MPEKGVCTFDGVPMTMMWIDSTMRLLMHGIRSMVGPERFALALVREGRDSIDGDWKVISSRGDFVEGFAAIGRVAAVAGWGRWTLVSLDFEAKRAQFRVENSWEGYLRENAEATWTSPFLAGKVAGYASRLFKTNCWVEQTASIVHGDAYDEFIVAPSSHTVEAELDNLLVTDKATRADMAVALKKLQDEIRDRQLAEEAAVAAMEKAKEASKAKSEFLANMSHEIRTPITAILGYGELLADSPAIVGDDRKFLSAIQRNGQALLRLISDLLDLSKIEERKLSVERVQCSFPDILRDVLAGAKFKAEPKGLYLRSRYATPIPELILTDPVRLRQVLANIVGNAVKFTPAGGVEVKVEMAPRGGRSFLKVSIDDTGIGIPEHQLPKMFLPFMPGEQSFTKSFEGSGLGLALSKRMIELLGGDIELSSQVGVGSSFVVWIDPGPVASVPTVSAVVDLEPRAVVEPNPGFAPLRGRVLVVEDVADVRELLTAYLQDFGVAFDTAVSGAEGCKKALVDAEAFDLVLMDVQMPVMDGLSATRILRSLGWSRPIIAVTAHAMSEERDRCLDAGCTDYLAKPLARVALHQTLRKYLPPLA